MFAGSCIGVICLVISLELLRRLGREYDYHLRRKDGKAAMPPPERFINHSKDASEETSPEAPTQTPIKGVHIRPGPMVMIQRQVVRATIHMSQFAVAYFIMLLAMYYNGRTRSALS